MLTKCFLSYSCAANTMRGEADKMLDAWCGQHDAWCGLRNACEVGRPDLVSDPPPYGKK